MKTFLLLNGLGEMLNIVLPFLLLLGSGPAASPKMTGDTPGSIHVVITNIPKALGTIRVALFNGEEGFREEEYAVRKELFPCKSQTETFVFKGLAPGRYAVAVYHDINNNGKLDTILFFPTEYYGFSNNVMGTFGPPSFTDASVVVQAGTKVVPIQLR